MIKDEQRRKLLRHGLHWLCAIASACTNGTVQNAATGELIGGAEVGFQALTMPASPPADHRQPPVSLGASFDVRTWSASDPGANGLAGVYYLNPYAPAGTTHPLTRAVPGGWNAVTVSKSGFDTRRFYRNHVYTPCQASTRNPISAGAYPADVSREVVDGALCARQDFALHASGTTYEKQPDLIVDPRSLLDYQRTTCLVDDCLVINTAYANVGDGDLFLVAPYREPTPVADVMVVPVTQLIARTDGAYRRAALDATFSYSGRPYAFDPEYFQQFAPQGGWMQARLRRVDPAVCATEAQATACPVVRELFRYVGPCLQDERTFDSTYAPGRNFAGCLLTVIDDAGRPSLVQGMSAGRGFADRWGVGIDVEGLAPGQYWLEVEVNVGRVVVESDYGNNIARTLIQL